MTEQVDTLVVGAGVVGLAVARSLARAGREVVILESQTCIGSATSSRNSEVVHAGLYYPNGSLKAELCVQGRHALYAYCEERGIAHRRIGKLLVSTDATQEPQLAALHANALGNGVEGLALISGAQARALEPALNATAALWSPATGIVDSHGLMLALQGEAEDHGAMLALCSPVLAVRSQAGAQVGAHQATSVLRTPVFAFRAAGQAHAGAHAQGLVVEVGGAQPMRVLARRLVNAAGLDAPRLARSIEGLAARHVPEAHYCKGHYFSLTGRAPFSHLVYPMHDGAGLGVHLTLDLAGQARFGPDVQWIEGDAAQALREGAAVDYAVDGTRAAAFETQIRRYWPRMPEGALQPAYSGMRPKVSAHGEPAADFVIQGPEVHGVPGLVNLFGIESPGLTAALAIGELVERLLRD